LDASDAGAGFYEDDAVYVEYCDDPGIPDRLDWRCPRPGGSAIDVWGRQDLRSSTRQERLSKGQMEFDQSAVNGRLEHAT